ncbi:allene oxide cyclase barrel-like domain-containing protein [Streptomyces sp. NBC_00105]|uniref:allene oxide cyclase barrel-like domain-containing protein n=1 Tax=unclassified Streptomyces TaxID=2593676 RepID=UPI0038659EE7
MGQGGRVEAGAGVLSSRCRLLRPRRSRRCDGRRFRPRQGQTSGHHTHGPAQGDRTVFRSELLDQDDKVVGETGGTCTTTRVALGGAEECVVTYTLPGGQLTVQGMVFGHLNEGPPPSFDNAITGGTGEFDRARGSVHAETTGRGERCFTIDLYR